MPRPTTGDVVVRERKRGRVYALRFSAYGKRRYITLGTAEDGWGRERAEAELRGVLADVERGIWQPHEPEPVEAPPDVPTFHEFASQWLRGCEGSLAKRTRTDYRWRLSSHLLPYFAERRLTDLTIEDVDLLPAGEGTGARRAHSGS